MGWTSKQKNINFLITAGCLWLPVVLCSLSFIFVINFFVLAQFGKVLLPIYHALCLPCMLHCWSYLWLCQLVVLDACKGATHDCLNIGRVSYQVPLALQQSRWQSTPVQLYISGQLRLTIIQCTCICTSTCTVSPDLSNFIGNLGIRNLFKGGWSCTKD